MICLHPTCHKETGSDGFCEPHWRALTPDLRIAYTESLLHGSSHAIEERIRRYFRLRKRFAELAAAS